MDLQRIRRRQLMIRALKIGIGSALSIVIAEALHLEYASSAGTVALLTILSTKWDTVKLAYTRIISFFIVVFIAWVCSSCFGQNWLTYGLYLFLIAGLLYAIGWDNTLSVSALIGVQLIMLEDFSLAFIVNEFSIVLIGIITAIIFNLLSDYQTQRDVIISDMRKVEGEISTSLYEISEFLKNPELEHSQAWARLTQTENYLEECISRAWNYQNDTFVSHPAYYIRYFEMRNKQASVLHNLHYQVRTMKKHPEVAAIAAQRLEILASQVGEFSDPKDAIQAVKAFYTTLAQRPSDQTNFEGQAVLYHLLINLEEFLVLKQRFNDSLDERQIRIYVRSNADDGYKRLSDIHF